MNSGKIIKMFLLAITAAVLVAAGRYALAVKKTELAYRDLYAVFQEYLSAEDGLFKTLSLRIDQTGRWLTWGQSAKIVLSDPLGRRWIFKPCLLQDKRGFTSFLSCTEKFSAVAIYRIYKLFGVATPRVGVINLRVNGKVLSGSLQEYVPNEGVLRAEYFPYFSPEACAYLQKSYALDWIFANVDFNLTNFLVVSYKDGLSPHYIMRLDNGYSMFSRQNCHFYYAVDMPVKSLPGPEGDDVRREYRNDAYFWFWDDYIRGRLVRRVPSVSDFLFFVRDFPEDYLHELVFYQRGPQLSWPSDCFGIQNYRGNAVDREEEIYERKRKVVDNFGKFYRQLASIKKEIRFPMIYNPAGVLRYIAAVSGGLREETARLRKQAEALRSVPRFSSDITAVFSLEGLAEVRKVYDAYDKDKAGVELKKAVSSALNNLQSLLRSASYAPEREALEAYLTEVVNISNGGAPSQEIVTINRIIDSWPPER
ncbi:MAG: hypothetical protein GX598_00445 [Elusimicrobia bacterium]|nr:hypothetical protein [Elusimicrobiota bacterium]